MHENPARLARRDALAHAQGVFGVAQGRRDRGISHDPRTELRAVREVIAERGVPGAAGSAEHAAGAEEREAILTIIDNALAGAGEATGFDPLTWAERMVQERLKAVLF
jgi:hypothetical protein